MVGTRLIRTASWELSRRRKITGCNNIYRLDGEELEKLRGWQCGLVDDLVLILPSFRPGILAIILELLNAS